MNKYVKGALIFTGGVTVGAGVGAGLVVVKALQSEKIRKVLYDKIYTVIFGEEPIRKLRYQSYKPYFCSTPDVIFGDHEEAEKVLNVMKEILTDHGELTVAEYKELCGLVPSFSDEEFGWITLDDVEVIEADNGFTIKLPRAITFK